MNSIVVTGASGFLGRHLCEQLVFRGYQVHALSRKKAMGFEFVTSYFESPSGDILIHLAENSDRGFVNQESTLLFDESTNLVRHLCSKSNKYLIYASSAAVYGNKSEHPHKTNEHLHSTDLYSSIKLACEKIVIEAGGMVARFSNLIGPGMSNKNVISDVLKQVWTKNEIQIRDDKPICDFLYIDDAVRALMNMCKYYSPGLVLNIGSGEGYSIGQIVKKILGLLNMSDKQILVTRSLENPSVSLLNIEETKALINWKPECSIDYALNKIIENWN